MTKFLFVDNSNLWIEGMKVSAVHKGMVPDVFAATELRITDATWRVDFGKLYKVLNGNIKVAYMYGSIPPPNDSLWESARLAGFQVKTFERSRYDNREKKVDAQLAADMFEVAVDEAKPEDTIILVSGDKDYVPIIEKIKKRKLCIIAAFWEHAASELVNSVDKFIPLDSLLNEISYS